MTTSLRFIRNFLHGAAAGVLMLPAVWSLPAAANLSGAVMSDYQAVPVTAVDSVTPLVMLAMSMDHQYWFKAYNDYSDLNEDGVVETTYTNSFPYYGYFHSNLCYRYSAGDGRFNPVGQATGDPAHYCEGALSDAWSGNFLNWATMTRMDIVRKILFGGRRSTDTPSETVLERALLPHDAHSFAKYYNGDDIDKLTPFSYGGGSGQVISDNRLGNGDGYDDAGEGITLCNTTHDVRGAASHTSTAPPLLRVVRTNRQLWSANERMQCTWEDEGSTSANQLNDNQNLNNPAQSGIASEGSDPPDGLVLRDPSLPSSARDHVVRVKVCDPATFVAANNRENCTEYGTNRKPEGLLQRFGMDDQVKFALMTGSYDKNISGGVLRKAFEKPTEASPVGMRDEVNVNDGTFITPPPNTGNIIHMLNAVRIYGYDYAQGLYFNENGNGFTGSLEPENCPFQLTSITEGRCVSWGNPMSEIYLEALRYFAIDGGADGERPGSQETAAFNADDSRYIPTLPKASWINDPLADENRCAALNIISFNASVNSEDRDATGGFDTLPSGAGAATLESLTNAVGTGEGITGNSFFIGRVPGSTNEICTAKSIDGLFGAAGLCPEGPTLDGSFHMSGMAYWARTNDIRPGTNIPDEQNIRTFAVALATNVPAIEVPVASGGNPSTVAILPAYRLFAGSGEGGGALVDFKVVRPHTEIDPTQVNALGQPTPAAGQAFPTAQPGSGTYHAKYYINWEDSEQGGDYDQDVWGTLDYVLSGNQLTITTNVVTESTLNPQLFGFITSGTTQDGFHAYSGIESANYTDPTGVRGCRNCTAQSTAGGQVRTAPVQQGPQSHTFTIGGSGGGRLLESPLYYAAKWGGFEDENNDQGPTSPPTPDLRREWDKRDTAGKSREGGDGIPDTFFFVTNPAALEAALTAVFNQIIERVSSGTAAAVVANDQEGIGAVFQALYDPVKRDTVPSENNEVRWIGTLHALWVDETGFIREDGDGDGQLDDYAIDPVIEIFFDEDADPPRSRIRRFDAGTGGTPPDIATATFEEVDLEFLEPVWNAREKLAELTDLQVSTQRTYDSAAVPGRHIITWLDDDLDGLVGSTEVVDFLPSTFDADNFGWLDADDLAEARTLVSWVRGTDVPGLRTRRLDYNILDTDDTTRTMRLGDIINATPIPVGTPVEAFDLLALDETYAEFRACWANRRQVVYVGANDGMLHAFNAGFFNAATDKFELTRTGPSSDNGVCASDDNPASHELGAELWAYLPRNLLPHLQWLARQDYSHVFMMDQTPRVFDARIFPADSTHVNGWGTILVAGMRFGGGADKGNNQGITVDVDNDGPGDGDGDGTGDAVTRSAYVVLDVTDPENPPVVLAELAPPNLNFTTVFPQVVAVQDPNATAPGKWYLVFGTGPDDLGEVSYSSIRSDPSTIISNAEMFVYDLANLQPVTASATAASGPDPTRSFELPDPDVFIGDPVVSDYDIDMRAETIYFGTVDPVETNDTVPQPPRAGLYRIGVNEEAATTDWSSSIVRLLSNVDKPFVAQPSITSDRFLRPWVIAGTGRLFVDADKPTELEQSLYGFIDPFLNPGVFSPKSGTIPAVDGSGLFDVTGVEVRTNGDIIVGGTTRTVDFVRGEIESADGWVRDYRTSPGDPAQRTVNRSTLIDGILFNTAFIPSVDLCGAEGTSALIGLAFDLGIPPVTGVFGFEACPSCPDDTVQKVVSEVDLGAGLASTPSVHIGEQDVPGKVTVIVQKSTGAIETQDATTLGGIRNGEISWRELRGLEN